jgi:hypothetical protein
MEVPPEFAQNPEEITTEQFSLTTKVRIKINSTRESALFDANASTHHQIQFAFVNMLPLALGTTKASFLFFYKRIFAVSKNSVTDILLKVSIAFVFVWTVALFFTTLFECGTNFWAAWGTVLDLKTHCFDSLKLILVLCITDFMLDVFIIIFPLPIVRYLVAVLV